MQVDAAARRADTGGMGDTKIFGRYPVSVGVEFGYPTQALRFDARLPMAPQIGAYALAGINAFQSRFVDHLDKGAPAKNNVGLDFGGGFEFRPLAGVDFRYGIYDFAITPTLQAGVIGNYNGTFDPALSVSAEALVGAEGCHVLPHNNDAPALCWSLGTGVRTDFASGIAPVVRAGFGVGF